MNKDEAREILEEWLNEQCVVILPIEDVVIHTKYIDKSIETYTWKYLLKIAYFNE